MKTTIQDLAELAGVSTATVDRVLNNRPRVHTKTREKVWAAARAVQYAVEEESGASAIGYDILLPEGPNPYIAALERRLLKRAFDFGANLRIVRCEMGDPATYAGRLAAIAEAGARQSSAGVVLVAPDDAVIRNAVLAVERTAVPVFTLIADLPGVRHSGYIGLENHSAGRLAGQVMARFLARRRATVAVIVGLPSYRNHEDRARGFRQAMAEYAAHLSIREAGLSRDDPATAVQTLQALIEEAPDLAGVYNVGAGVDLLGESVNAGRRRRLVLIGHELTEQTQAGLLAGSIDAIIDQDVDTTAVAVIEALTATKRRRSLSEGYGRLLPRLVLRENIPNAPR